MMIRNKHCIALIFLGLLFPIVSRCQSIPPGRISHAATTSQNAPVAAAPTKCDQNKSVDDLHWWLPLAHLPEDQAEELIECFYQTSGKLDPLNQVRFFYGIGGGDSKTLSADLVSILFPGGLQANLGSSVTMGTSTPKTVTTLVNGQPQSTAQQNTDSGATAIDKLESGGDFYVRFDYPLIFKNNNDRRVTGLVVLVPKLAFNFSGFGSESTITEATEYNANTSIESYGEWRAFKDAGLLYGDVRSGWQYVQPTFSRAIGIGEKHNFALTQIAAGIEFSQLIRIGFQRYIGPAAALGVTNAQLSKWHLILQLAPKKKQ